MSRHVTDGEFLCGCFMQLQEAMVSDSRDTATKIVIEKTEREKNRKRADFFLARFIRHSVFIGAVLYVILNCLQRQRTK